MTVRGAVQQSRGHKEGTWCRLLHVSCTGAPSAHMVIQSPNKTELRKWICRYSQAPLLCEWWHNIDMSAFIFLPLWIIINEHKKFPYSFLWLYGDIVSCTMLLTVVRCAFVSHLTLWLL